MAAELDPVFGIHADALAVQRRRMEVLAANIANADTPGYKARDIDFGAALNAAQKRAAGAPAPATTTDPRHFAIATPGGGSAVDAPLSYRVATQPSVDGNTVDTQVEQAKFADAALHYQASLSFADARIKSLMTAITGQ